MLALLVWLVVIVAAFSVAWWIVSQINLPQPMALVVRVIFGIVALAVLLYFVTGVIGPPPHLGRL